MKATALEEESTEFDPSGSAGQSNVKPDHELSGSSYDAEASSSNADGLASASDGLSAVSINDGIDRDGMKDIDLETLDDETKLLLLKDVFPDMNDFTISYTFKKCDHNWQRALDDLLNQSYFLIADGVHEDDRVLAKGVDAFSENAQRRGRKTKRKGRSQEARRSDSLPLTGPDTVPSTNKWQSASNDIDFIVLHSNLDSSLVRSAYYTNHTSVSETIAYFIKDTMKSTSRIASSDPAVQAHAVALGRDFPTIAPDYLTALIRLTHPSMTSAEQLAKALTTKRSSSSSTSLTPRYARPSLSDDEHESADARKSRPTSVPSGVSVGCTAATDLAASHSLAYRTATAQAHAAYRKSRSNHLMAGAAGYYAQVGREHMTAHQRYNSAAADALVESQSTSEQVDLHGVNVQDALRIVKRRVELWWDGLGESRVNGRVGAADRAKGFSIITGVGRHSEGGKSKLGPAVSRMLAAEGWKVEGGSGVLYVKGR